MSWKFPLSVVVLTMNRPTLLHNCLRILFAHTATPFELVLLDNGSSMPQVHEILDALAAEHPDSVRLIKSDMNLGCGIGRAKALAEATGETLATLDSDMCVTPGWETTMLDRLYESDDIAAVGAKIINPDNHLFGNGGVCRTIGSGFVHLENIDFCKTIFDPTLAGRRDCDWVPAGAMMMRRAAYEQSPYSSRRYKNCMVEINVAFKMRRRGWRVVNCPEAVTYHYSDVLEEDQKKDYFAVRRSAAVFCQSTLYFQDDFGVNPVTSWDCPRHFLRMDNPSLLTLHEFFQDLRTHLADTGCVHTEPDGVRLYDVTGIEAFLTQRGIEP